jgi:hypothetical protein
MREQVIAAAVGCDKPKTLTVVEPLDGAGIHETLQKMNEQMGPREGSRNKGSRRERTTNTAGCGQ